MTGTTPARCRFTSVFIGSLILSALPLLAVTNPIAPPETGDADMPEPAAVLLASGLEGASGSTVGPDGALYVTEGAAGRVSRLDPETGAVTPFVTGLPPSLVGIGGAIDVAFLDGIGYVLVTLVGPDFGGASDDVIGIYRVDGPNAVQPIANIGEFSINNPPATPFDVRTGLQFALEIFRGEFLVSDGHHNRVLRVTRDGDVSELFTFGNTVPTGLEVHGDNIYVAEAGATPHLPQDGKVLLFGLRTAIGSVVASGAPLLVDVERHGNRLYALSQGIFPEGGLPAEPALPDTGALVAVTSDGTFATLVPGLNRPTSLELIGNTAYVITLGGEVWKIDDVLNGPFERP